MSPEDLHSDPTTQPIPVIGIVGGVGSGKSSVAKTLAELVPVAIIDADQLGHRALELAEVKEKLRQRFGAAIFDPDGNVVRPELAAIVFGDAPEALAARADLEAITHPVIGRMALEQIAQLQSDHAVRWILIDAALLLEAGWHRKCDAVVFVDVSPEIRAERVRSQRGWSDEEWKRREASQWSVDQKRAAADVVISNNGPVTQAVNDLRQWLEQQFCDGKQITKT